MIHKFNHKGKLIEVGLGNDPDTNYFKFQDAESIVHRFIVIDPITNIQEQAITLKFITQLETVNGTVVSAPKLNTVPLTDDVKPGEYKLYHGASTGVATMGDIAFRSAINGILEAVFNTKAFNPVDGLVEFQPVSHSLEATQADEITATLIDGGGTIKWNIDGGEWQDSNVFSALDAGEHIVGCKTVEDDYPIFETITL